MITEAEQSLDSAATKPHDVGSVAQVRTLSQYAAVVLLGIAGYSVASIKPLVVTSYVTKFGLSTHAAGYLLGAEMTAMALGTLSAAASMTKARGRRYVLFALLTIVVGDFGSMAFGAGLALVGFRILAGLGHGFALGRLAAAIAAFDHPDRASGIYTVCALAYAAAFSLSLPALQGMFGPRALFTIGVVAAVAALGTLRWLPMSSAARHERRVPGSPPASSRLNRRTVAHVTIAVSFYYLSIGVYWAFVGQFSAAVALDYATKARIIGCSSLISILGASISIILSDRFGRFGLITALLCLQLISIATLFFAGQSIPQYALSLWAYLFSWLALFPYLLGLMSKIDPIGRLNGLVYGVTGIAFAIGPIFSGWLIGQSRTERLGLVHVQEISFCLMAVAVALLISLAAKHKRLPLGCGTASSC